MAEEIRQLTVDGQRYGWRVTHAHRDIAGEKRVCMEQFLAFREGTTAAPLRISFAAGSEGGPEYLQRHGVFVVYAHSMTFNLHKPRTAAALIRRALELGWSTDAPFTVEDGFAFLSAMPDEARKEIAEPIARAR